MHRQRWADRLESCRARSSVVGRHECEADEEEGRAEEEALLAELNSLIPDIYAPFNFEDDVDEEKLLDDLEELIE